MQCNACGNEVTVYSSGEGTNSYELVNKKLHFDKGDIQVPFYCQLCGAIVSPLKAVRDVVMVFPKILPEKIGSIYLPEGYFVGGETKERFKDAIGVVVSVGPGHFDRKNKEFVLLEDIEIGDKVYYDKRLPIGWRMHVKGTDGKEHALMYWWSASRARPWWAGVIVMRPT